MDNKQVIKNNISKMVKNGDFEDRLIYIFGSNIYTRTIIHELAEHNCKLAGILDNAPEKQGEIIEDIGIYSPDTLKAKVGEAVILIASAHYYEMLRQLESFGFQAKVDVVQLIPCVNRDNVKYFWTERAKKDISTLPCEESIVTLNSNEDLAGLQVELERQCIDKHIDLKKSDILVDLGAGIGRWSRYLASRVKKVYAVEMVERFVEISEKLAIEERIENIIHVRQSAESFIPDFTVDYVFISGILCILDEEQYEVVIDNVANMLKNGNGGGVCA